MPRHTGRAAVPGIPCVVRGLEGNFPFRNDFLVIAFVGDINCLIIV
jgi:hypothetical protein